MAKLDLESSIEAIGTLALAEPAPLMPGMPGSEIMPENATATSDPWSDLRDVQEEHKAAINASNLIAFVEGVSAEQKGDVLDSTQFAARAADAEFNRGSQIREWYDAYVEVLTKMGWVIEGFAFQQSRHAEGAMLMSQEAIGVITAVATGNQLAILEAAIDSLGKMADDSRQIKLFDFNVSVETGGNFQIGAAEAADNGAIGMAMGAFYYRSNDNRRNVLFFGWGSQEIEMWTAAQRLVLDTTFYADLRDVVRQRLGEKSKDFVATIPII